MHSGRPPVISAPRAPMPTEKEARRPRETCMENQAGRTYRNASKVVANPRMDKTHRPAKIDIATTTPDLPGL